MRQREDWEEKIKNVLALECDGVTASRDLKDRIDREILESQKEAGNMKKLSVKKLVIGVAVGCLLVSGGVFAAGHAVSFSTHSFLPDAYRSYSDLGKAEGELGYTADTVESFSNGYKFERMSVDEWQGEDEAGNAVYTFKQLDITYGRKGEEKVSLIAEKPVETPVRNKEPDAVRQVGDITLYYDITTFKFVPPNYELTDEDRANLEKPNYEISYGSDEVQIQQSYHVTWDKNGIHYQIFGFDLSLSADEMFDMAEEIMGTK